MAGAGPRNKSGKPGRQPEGDFEDRSDYMASRVNARSDYNRNLSNLISPEAAKNLPPDLRRKLGLDAVDASTSPAVEDETTKLLRELEKTPNAATLAAYLAAGHKLPDGNTKLLVSLLSMDNEVLLVPVMQTLEAALRGGKTVDKLAARKLVTSVKGRAKDKKTIEAADRLAAAIR